MPRASAPSPVGVTLTGRAAQWATERAQAEGRPVDAVVEEALASRWGLELGDAYRAVWAAGPGLTSAAAGALVEAEVYGPRRRARRGG
ncbi:MAG TPA: hypothetical protein VMW47_13140 [Verrucomicrobiae bacterium]|nr:hypothetical protein [Verrucomicrobiae bacterium]